MKIIIIGNSAASTSAIEAIRMHDTKSEILQFTDETYPLYSRCLTTYFISNEIEEKTLLYRPKNFHEKMHVDLKTGNCVVEIDPKAQKIRDEEGE